MGYWVGTHYGFDVYVWGIVFCYADVMDSTSLLTSAQSQNLIHLVHVSIKTDIYCLVSLDLNGLHMLYVLCMHLCVW